MKPTIIAAIAFIGIGCLCFAALGASYFRTSVIEDTKQKVMSDFTGENMTATYTKPFHLDFDQTCQITIKMNANSTPAQDDVLRVIILPAEIYNQNSTGKPSLVQAYGLYFANSSVIYPQAAPTPSANTVWLLNRGLQSIPQKLSFMGGRSTSTNLVSIPGDYYAVIWVNDTGVAPQIPDGSIITFDLKIELSGLNDTLGLVFNVAGLGCLILAGVLVVMYIRKEGR